MKKTTYHNPDVIKISESFIPVMIDSDVQRNLAAKYKVSGLPTYVIAKPDGTTIRSFDGYLAAGDFITHLKAALQ